MNLEFFTFNNYYNRIIKKYNTIAEYEAVVPSTNTAHYYDINFNPNDGVNTEVVVDTKNFSGSWVPDYLVVYDDTLQASEAIQSRWFVIEWVRLRNGQYQATLHRDVIADNLTALQNAPIYVEKATVPNETDVAIYNQENLEVNQIKQSEILLRDRTNSAWLVGYFAKKIDFGTGSEQISRTINIGALDVDAITVNTLAGWSWYNYVNTDYKLANSVDAKLYVGLDPQFLGINAGGYLLSIT